MIKTICWSFSHTLIIYIYFVLGKPALFSLFIYYFFLLFCKMYNMQFQHSTYLDQPQYDLNSNNKAALPSPMTASSLDSPPNNKVHNQYNTMPLSSSPKSSYANRIQQQQQQYDMYMNSNTNNFPQPITIPTAASNTNAHTKSPTLATSPHQNYYSSSVPDSKISDTLVSPTSPGSLEDEILQRK